MGTISRSRPRALRPRLPKAGARKGRSAAASAPARSRPEAWTRLRASRPGRRRLRTYPKSPSLRPLLPKRGRRNPCRKWFRLPLRQSGLPGGLTSLPRLRQHRLKSRKMPWSRKSRCQPRPWRVYRQTGNRRPRPRNAAVAVRASPREQNPMARPRPARKRFRRQNPSRLRLLLRRRPRRRVLREAMPGPSLLMRRRREAPLAPGRLLGLPARRRLKQRPSRQSPRKRSSLSSVLPRPWPGLFCDEVRAEAGRRSVHPGRACGALGWVSTNLQESRNWGVHCRPCPARECFGAVERSALFGTGSCIGGRGHVRRTTQKKPGQS